MPNDSDAITLDDDLAAPAQRWDAPSIAVQLPAFGALIPNEGGHFAAIMRGPVVDGVQAPPYALLKMPAALDEAVGVVWGKYGVDVPGCASRTDGQANFAAMLAAGCPAALRVQEVASADFPGQRLPSLGELNAMAANVPELFDPKGYYWTSTQVSRGSAFVVDFEDGYSYWDNKDSDYRVCAVRAIPLERLTTSTL